MKFKVTDLKRMARAARELGTREGKSLYAMLKREQPEFCRMVDWVGMDPRCIEAHRFCTRFCALALRHARAVTGRRLKRFPADAFQDWAQRLLQRRGARTGVRASGYRRRIRRHALLPGEFDEDDSNWLCTTLSAFLLVVEGCNRA